MIIFHHVLENNTIRWKIKKSSNLKSQISPVSQIFPGKYIMFLFNKLLIFNLIWFISFSSTSYNVYFTDNKKAVFFISCIISPSYIISRPLWKVVSLDGRLHLMIGLPGRNQINQSINGRKINPIYAHLYIDFVYCPDISP